MAEKPDQKAVRDMFAGIAGRYDLMNRLMTFGRDRAWRRHVVRRAVLPRGGRMLDVGTGTGDIAREAALAVPDLTVVGADFTLPMMLAGRRRPGKRRLLWCCADALFLPFADGTFDSVTSGYLVRNVTDLPRALREQFRVLKPGGKMVCLETSPPQVRWLAPFIQLYFKAAIPLLGRIFAGDRKAYRYLPESTRAFMPPEALKTEAEAAGFSNVGYTSFMMGTMVVMDGTRP